MPDRLSHDQLDVLIGAAVAAPSMHNTQPWRFEVSGPAIDVYADTSRALPAEDPTGRALRIATGAAVFNLRCAAAHLGLDSWYGFAPAEDEPDLLARVITAPGNGAATELANLYQQINRRHTNREPAGPTPLSPDQHIALVRAAAAEGTDLTWLTQEAVHEVLTRSSGAALRAWADRDRTAERARWIGANRTEDGIPLSALGPRPALYPAPIRDLGAGLPGGARGRKLFELEPALAVLSTESDDPVTQLGVGMALERILLTATQCGISASFLNEALEYDTSRQAVQAATGKPGFAQMVIRFSGRPATATVTPRRRVDEVVHTTDD